jgi:hypothetical protein
LPPWTDIGKLGTDIGKLGIVATGAARWESVTPETGQLRKSAGKISSGPNFRKGQRWWTAFDSIYRDLLVRSDVSCTFMVR